MKITGRRIKAIIREELNRSLDEIRASLGVPSIDEFRPELMGYGEFDLSPQDAPIELDPDDDSDDMDEILDLLSDEFNVDQLRALASVIRRAKDAREARRGRRRDGAPWSAAARSHAAPGGHHMQPEAWSARQHAAQGEEASQAIGIPSLREGDVS